MWYYILLALVASMLARKGRARRKFRRYIRGTVDKRLSLGTLAGDTAIAANFDGTVSERTWCSSVVATWGMDEFTTGTDDGPIIVGLAHSDYTAAEIEEWVENNPGWSEADQVAQEIGQRKIRRVGMFADGASASVNIVLNDGRQIHTKCGWMLLQGQTIKVWAYNAGSSPLATTDPTVHVQGHANLWPN